MTGTWHGSSARTESDFQHPQPHLVEIVSLLREAISISRAADDRFDEDYDVLVDDYEPRLKSAEIARVFDELKAATIPLVQEVRERSELLTIRCCTSSSTSQPRSDSSHPWRPGLDFTDDAWRLDVTEHPFASSIAIDDIRITTRYYPDYFNPSWFGTMHEFGHGLYEHGVSHSLERTPLARGASMAFHESQSRMWENLIGRGRPFWTWALPDRAGALPGSSLPERRLTTCTGRSTSSVPR